MSAKEFFTKGWPTRLGFQLARYIPPRGGNLIAAFAARLIVTTKPDMYRAARANLRHVVGPDVSDAELGRMAHRLFLNVCRGYYELFHNVSCGEVRVENFHPPVLLTPEARTYFRQALDSGRGLFILGCHMSNFDLGGIGMSQYIPAELQALSLASPPPGFEFFNRLREMGHGIVTPITPRTLRDAMARLRAGGVVLTGVDRPIGEGNEPVEFFGATAYLPAGYIRIPLKTDCLVVTVSFIYEDGVYWILANPPMEMERTGDRQQDIAINLRRVLAQIEAFIRRAPEQWMMFVPVWKDDDGD